jgi:insertion element IS1 protein InsB
MVLEPVLCPDCQSSDVVKHGQSAAGKQRYKCRNPECRRSTFIKHYSYRGYLREVKQQITQMALNGSGIRDTARVLSISPTTVIEELKKSRLLRQVNSPLLEQLLQPDLVEVVVERVEAAEMDEMWSFVSRKKN